MPSLKDLKNRIGSVKKTRKITSAMKMVAAAKLRRAQDQAVAARPYAERMDRMLVTLASKASKNSGSPLMVGTGKDDKLLILLMTADRGLCGGFNANIIKKGHQLKAEAEAEGKQVTVMAVGRRGRDSMLRADKAAVVWSMIEIDKPVLEYSKAADVATEVLMRFDNGEFDRCVMVYSKFQSAISQIVTAQQIVPFAMPETADEAEQGPAVNYEYEPDEGAILEDLLPRNIGVQVFRAMLENAASEHGARMTAMDNATRNAGDMIESLTLVYNRTRQAQITKELIEIVSGAEAL